MNDRRRHERRGRDAERWALVWLMAQGYRPLARRYKTPVGELDLILRRRRTLVFVEVKLRASIDAGKEALRRHQQARIRRAAEYFLSRNSEYTGYDARIDALLLAPWRWPCHIRDIA